jgi:hypothetical protein
MEEAKAVIRAFWSTPWTVLGLEKPGVQAIWLTSNRIYLSCHWEQVGL